MINQLFELLGVGDGDSYKGSWKMQDGHFKITKLSDNDFNIKYGKMYEPPKLNLGNLIELSKLLGTTDINVDDYSIDGCESCDYGSDYGHDIRIKGITKNLEEFESLVEKKYE